MVERNETKGNMVERDETKGNMVERNETKGNMVERNETSARCVGIVTLHVEMTRRHTYLAKFVRCSDVFGN